MRNIELHLFLSRQGKVVKLTEESLQIGCPTFDEIRMLANQLTDEEIFYNTGHLHSTNPHALISKERVVELCLMI